MCWQRVTPPSEGGDFVVVWFGGNKGLPGKPSRGLVDRQLASEGRQSRVKVNNFGLNVNPDVARVSRGKLE